MAKGNDDFQQLKGVGKVLAKRMKAAGMATFQDVVRSGEEGLKKVGGIAPRSIGSILDQAARFIEEKSTGKSERIASIRRKASELQQTATGVGDAFRQRPVEEVEGKCGRKVLENLGEIVEALDRMQSTPVKKTKRAQRALEKIARRLEGLEQAGLRKIRKGLKKSRKALVRVLA